MTSDVFSPSALNIGMASLKHHTNELFRKMQRDGAFKSLSYNYNPKQWKRYIRGIAISSRQANANLNAFDATGAQITLPGLLLIDHEFMHPLGRITEVKAQGEELRFTAEIANAVGPYWIDETWPMIAMGELKGISIGPRPSSGYLVDGVYSGFELEEISVVRQGADPNARITAVWEKAPVIYLDGRPTKVMHWSE